MSKIHEYEAREFGHKLEDVIAFFNRKGLRWTPQRQLIVTSFKDFEGHITADEVYKVVSREFPRVNLSTVYRTLELLSEMGLLVEMISPTDNLKRYEARENPPHYHLVCENCQKSIEVEPETIERLDFRSS
jgi:Fur family transcriptional regulator, ferric uptake regulator